MSNQSKVIIVAGETGSGKSTSIATLNEKETFLINYLGKILPFPKAMTRYSAENKNYTNILGEGKSIIGILHEIDKNPALAHIKHVVIDDIGFSMSSSLFDRAEEKGFDKFTTIAKEIQQILKKCLMMRPDLKIVLMFHTEDVASDGIIVKRKLKLMGKMLEEKFDPLGTVTTALFTLPIIDKDGDVKYNFVTNLHKHKGVEIPAKSSYGMFNEKLIPNDLSIVFKAIDEYYN